MRPAQGRFRGTQRPLREGGGMSAYPPPSIAASAASCAARLICAALALAALLPRAAYAQQMSPPSVVRVHSVRVVRDVLQPGDAVFLVHYEVQQPNPTAPLSDSWYVAVVSGTATAGVRTAYGSPFVSGGWGQNAIALYVPARPAEPWAVELRPNPARYPPGVLPTRYDVVPADVHTGAAHVAPWVVEVSGRLGAAWNRQLVQPAGAGAVLTADGEQYWNGAAPGLQRMAPALFPVREAAPEWAGGAEEGSAPLAGEAPAWWRDALGRGVGPLRGWGGPLVGLLLLGAAVVLPIVATADPRPAMLIAPVGMGLVAYLGLMPPAIALAAFLVIGVAAAWLLFGRIS
jgi:hypothetical protein